MLLMWCCHANTSHLVSVRVAPMTRAIFSIKIQNMELKEKRSISETFIQICRKSLDKTRIMLQKKALENYLVLKTCFVSQIDIKLLG